MKLGVALVTGGASGLGKACVEHLYRRGVKVVMCDLPKSQGVKVAREFGPCVEFAPTDVTSETDVSNALGLAKEKFGKLDCVVNCAGVGLVSRVYDFKNNVPHKLDDFIKIMMVNAVGTFNVVRLAAGLIGQNSPDKDGNRGVIVNTSSIAALGGTGTVVAYAGSKGAVASMTLPLARDFANQGIRVVTIAPGIFDTPMQSQFPGLLLDTTISTIPHPKRAGKPKEFASFVLDVIDNPLINGEVIRLDCALRL